MTASEEEGSARREGRAKAMSDLAVLLLIWSFAVLPVAWVVGVLGDGTQAVLALVGVVLALGAFLAGKLQRGSPGLWLLATGVTWGAWLLYMLYLAYG